MPLDMAKFNSPATKGELAFVAADLVIAVQQLRTAVIMLKNANFEGFQAQLDEVSERTEKVWERYMELTGQENSDG